MYQAGVLWPLLLSLFSYDFTLEESGVQASQETNQQHVANNLAKLSLMALGHLGGYRAGAEIDGNGAKQNGGESEPPPENPAVKKSLAAMLTPYIACKLGTSSPAEVRTSGIRATNETDLFFSSLFLSYPALYSFTVLHRDPNLLKACMCKT